MMTPFETALAAFCKTAEAAFAAQYARDYPNSPHMKPPTVATMDGKRYVRVVRVESTGVGRSSIAFIDKTNGDVLKSAGWKAPAKGVRGSVYQNDLASVRQTLANARVST